MKNWCFALMCFLCCFNGVQFGEERKKIKIGETVTLHAEDNATEQIKDVAWTKADNVFMIWENGAGRFLNPEYESIICTYNSSSITICNATRDSMGMYTSQTKYKNGTTSKKVYYVEENNDFCDGITSVNVTEGQTVNLPVEGFRTGSRIRWIKDNTIEIAGNDRYKIAANSSLSICNLTKEDEGNYTVCVRAEDGPECNHTFTCSVLSLPVRSSRSSSWSDINIASIVFGTVIIVAILVVIVLKKNNSRCCRNPRNDTESPEKPHEREHLNGNQQNGVHSNQEEIAMYSLNSE